MDSLSKFWAKILKFLGAYWHWLAIILITVGAIIYFYWVFSTPPITPPYS